MMKMQTMKMIAKEEAQWSKETIKTKEREIRGDQETAQPADNDAQNSDSKDSERTNKSPKERMPRRELRSSQKKK